MKSYAILFLLPFACLANLAQADEIIVSGTEVSGGVTIGDFDCNGCSAEPANSYAMLMGRSSGIATAGELWKFFDRQGIKSVKHLTICLDVAPQKQKTGFGLKGVELKIEDPSSAGQLLTNAALGGHELLVPDYEISPFKPEAQLKVELGYDFMQRFSAKSQEKVSLNFSPIDEMYGDPVFMVQSDPPTLQSSFSLPLLFGFITFWVMVFVLLTRITRPSESASSPQSPISVPSTSNRKHAVSA